MSYNNLDYISKLNLENIDGLQFPSDPNGLASFTDSSFFDFDQFPISQDLKLENQQQFQNQIQDQPQQQGQNQSQNKDNLDLLNFDPTFIKTEEDYQFRTPNLPIEPKQSPVELEQKSTPQQQSRKRQASVSIASSPSTPNEAHSEFDKKKRNTAASARFRVKKKLKEQEMERNLKELQEKIQGYNLKIQKLEMENKCLKSLIIEKNEQKSNDLLKQIKERSIIRSD